MEFRCFPRKFRTYAPQGYTVKTNTKQRFSENGHSALRTRFFLKFGSFWPRFGAQNAPKSHEVNKKTPSGDRPKNGHHFFNFRLIFGYFLGPKAYGS